MQIVFSCYNLPSLEIVEYCCCSPARRNFSLNGIKILLSVLPLRPLFSKSIHRSINCAQSYKVKEILVTVFCFKSLGSESLGLGIQSSYIVLIIFKDFS